MKYIIAFLLAIFATQALAQTPPRRPLTGNLVNDLRNSVSETESNNIAVLSKPFQDLASFISTDAAAAITLSTQIPALQDGHGQQCWIAMSTAGDVFKAHPVPLTLKAMTDIEALRLLQITANNLCSNIHCTQVFADLSAAAQSASPVLLPIPTLHDLCSKIPQISLVAPVTPPVVATPTSTPQ